MYIICISQHSESREDPGKIIQICINSSKNIFNMKNWTCPPSPLLSTYNFMLAFLPNRASKQKPDNNNKAESWIRTGCCCLSLYHQHPTRPCHHLGGNPGGSLSTPGTSSSVVSSILVLVVGSRWRKPGMTAFRRRTLWTLTMWCFTA